MDSEENRGIRINKLLASCGLGSRRACEELVTAGRVTVNGFTCTELSTRVQEDDEVALDGEVLRREAEHPVYVFCKPAGVVCTSDDPQGRRTVTDYFRDIPERLYCVGRLDMDTEGLILVTNDGELTRRLTHPSHGVEKEYECLIAPPLQPDKLNALRRGVRLEEFTTGPAAVRVIGSERGLMRLSVTIHEGHNRQVRRMVEAVGSRVVYLRRIREGSLLLGNMKPGERRRLSEAEVAALYEVF